MIRIFSEGFGSSGEIPEEIFQPEDYESEKNGLLVKREILENGVRVVSIEKINNSDVEDLIQVDSGLDFNAILKSAYDEGNAEKILDTVKNYCGEQGVYVRGVCWEDGNYVGTDDEILYMTPIESCSDSGAAVRNIMLQIENFRR